MEQAYGSAESSSDIKQYVVEVGLVDGGTLTGEASDDAHSALADLHHRLASDPFVTVSDRLVVRSSDVRYVRVREVDDSPGLFGTLKDKIGGSMSGYGQESGGGYSQGGGYEQPTETYGGGGGGAVRTVPRGDGGRQGQRGGGWMDDIGYGRRPWSETKPFFLTSEFLTLVLAALGVGIAIATTSVLDAHHGWTLMTALAIGYMVSRGLAKSGARDPNPDRRYRD